MDREPRRWSVVQRFTFIEQRLYWEGRLNKSDLRKRFSISAPQATADIAHYELAAPENMTYDARLKAFVPTASFKPEFMVPDARQYLSQLLLLADSAIGESASWLGLIPAHDAIPRVRRKLDAEILRPIVAAIHTRRALQVVYQSMSTPEPTRRKIAPHALAFDGFRWHTRAWCFKKSMFIDLVLARLSEITDDGIAAVDSGMDREWHQVEILRLGPHPGLTPAQKKAVALDYGMKGEIREVPIRLALFYYFERHYCLDLEGLSPKRQQVVLLNRPHILAMLGSQSSADG